MLIFDSSHLYYLGDKYDIVYLRNKIIAHISEQKVSKENVLDLAIAAEENNHHTALSEALYDAAAGFVKEAVNRVGSKFNEVIDLYTDENEVHALVIFKLLKRVKNYTCENCQQSPCLSGQKVTRQNFAPGATAAIPSTAALAAAVRLILIQVEGGESFSFSFSFKYKGQIYQGHEFLYKCD